MYKDKRDYIDAHSIEWDILHSDCRDCYVDNLICTRYNGECRKQIMEEKE